MLYFIPVPRVIWVFHSRSMTYLCNGWENFCDWLFCGFPVPPWHPKSWVLSKILVNYFTQWLSCVALISVSIPGILSTTLCIAHNQIQLSLWWQQIYVEITDNSWSVFWMVLIFKLAIKDPHDLINPHDFFPLQQA